MKYKVKFKDGSEFIFEPEGDPSIILGIVADHLKGIGNGHIPIGELDGPLLPDGRKPVEQRPMNELVSLEIFF